MRVVVLGVLAACAGGAPDEPADARRPDPGPAKVADPCASGGCGGPSIAFVDVAVAAMEAPGLAAHQTVVVRGDAIVAVGPVDRVEVPANAQRVDGRGKFLIPGLHDMHVHLDGTRGMLALFVGSGVTSVRNMAGSPRIIALRDRIARGELLGPRIHTAGPFVDGPRPRWEASDVVATVADAERVVGEEAAAGYDFVKVYNGLTVETYDAVAAAARARGLKIAGHVPFAVPLDHVLAAGQASIEHLAGYAIAIERADSPVRKQRTTTGVIKRWMYADPAKIPEVAAETARHGVWNCPTLVTAVVYDELWRGETPTASDLDTVSPDWRARWDPKHSPKQLARAVRKAAEQAHGKTLDVELALVRELVAAGAPLLAGTDTPNPYVVPGASLHQELALLVAGGLSPYAALRTATSDAAEFLGDPHAGRIAPDAHADLVLLDADPLADIHALDHISGVMAHGQWLPPERLRAIHDGLVETYRAPAWESAIDLAEVAPGARTVQYAVADNSVTVGAYAVARRAGVITERQTLEDETITTRVAFGADHRARSLSLDVDRPEGVTHIDHHARELVPWLTPATAHALVEGLVLDIDQKLQVAITQPDADAPGILRRGQLTISRLAGASATQRVYRLRLVIDRVAWVARVVLEGDGLPSLLRLSSTTRPVVRTWKRR